MNQETVSDGHTGNTLATRIRTLNILLLTLVFVLVAGASVYIIREVNSGASRNVARAYSVATSAQLDSFISQNLDIARIASDSEAMGAWYGDEDNLEKKQVAYAELINYVSDNPDLSLRLCLSGSMNVYLVNAGIGFEDFLPYGKLDPAAPGDGWYDDCAKADGAYTLHLGVNTDPDERQLIICHKIGGSGSLKGVFSLGADLKPLLEEVAVATEGKAAGCLIDRQGEIVYGSFFPAAPGAPESAAAIEVSAGLKPAFNPGAETAASPDGTPGRIYKLTQGPYKYASVTPVAATGWSYAALYNYDLTGGIINDKNLPYLPVALLAILLLYFLIFNAYVRKIVFNPLKNLTNSVPRGGVIYGMGRNDEIGALASRINGMYFSISSQSSKVHEANEHLRFFLDSLPVSCHVWNKDHKVIGCNLKALELYGFKEKYEFTDHFFDHAPEFQTGGERSADLINKMLEKALAGEAVTFEWRRKSPASAPLLEVNLARVISGNSYVVAAYSIEK